MHPHSVAGPISERSVTLRRLIRWGRGLFLAALALLFAPLAACAATNIVTVTTATGQTSFTVEIADTPKAREKGLMYRTHLDSDAGMLFDFHKDRQVAFWMQNTLIPLDMVFIGADGRVRNVHANARPLDPTAIPSDGPVRYVLEIAGGRAAEIGLEPGDAVSLPQGLSDTGE